MKREIKFRAYSSHNHKMYPVSNIEWDIDGRIWVTADDGKNGIELIDEEAHLMQFTGLKDKNGREIYEGDILDIGLRNQDGKPVVAPVSYETYAAGYVLDNGGNGIWQRLTKDCEVIGNIFENQELLEGKQ
ncbi:YopX family protein [Lacticaseibacillus parahuelsenbergensis]|uniref:YopX family protein n=1 Tax=Lacticaseibacillus parahuelsenbergensis TaxID=3068305 RepID=A0ABY9L4G7_9LACO|nr:YopX family protein [Lacticaseibacillus sp. NCIMB 15471]WLV78535.1 YopX family protein [Lacticaseibacillus sp. NCIMB 15471]